MPAIPTDGGGGAYRTALPALAPIEPLDLIDTSTDAAAAHRTGPPHVALVEGRVVELERDVEHLRRALDSRTQIATAVGLLAERHRCTSAQAWGLLTKLSNLTNRKVQFVAQLLVAVVDGELATHELEVAAELARHLPRALDATGLGSPRGPT